MYVLLYIVCVKSMYQTCRVIFTILFNFKYKFLLLLRLLQITIMIIRIIIIIIIIVIRFSFFRKVKSSELDCDGDSESTNEWAGTLIVVAIGAFLVVLWCTIVIWAVTASDED